ncbi:hypothetical protein [Mycobacterium sp. 236(2023)]|uniref:hypothetical protein n=1 Tax=Mycobacterium sp. 236(2023) TaxID=3038163 RepID=UPI00241574B8|nr:hypothetical protein [Mycobacterium sp. 236(2023)]MDG4665070.1 hypothetical protein [Mycobacterium sp. 236(2023)]
MLSAIAIVPSAPVMVPELASSAASETEDMRAAAVSAAAALPTRWVAVGVAAADAVHGSDSAGTFAGYGVDIGVGLSPEALGDPTDLPLCALITGWLRGVAQPHAVAQVHTYRSDHTADEAVEFGRQLRAQIDAEGDDVGVLVVADGANTLTPPAPGGYDPDSVAVQAALDDALSRGDTATLTSSGDAAVGRVAYQVLAGLAGTGRPGSAEELYRGAPYGVGYFVGVWTP